MTDFFPPRPPATPTIYAFAGTHPDHAGLLANEPDLSDFRDFSPGFSGIGRDGWRRPWTRTRVRALVWGYVSSSRHRAG
jgi:hypothetical protein